MIPQRLSVKFPAKTNKVIELSAFIPLFHKFIQTKAVEGLLIDVADYEHVPSGPGVLLIGHDVDYGMDMTGGQPGLLVRRKRYTGKLACVLKDTLRKGLLATAAIEADGTTGVQFNTSSFEVTLIDRLAAPNTPAARDAVKGDILALATQLFGDSVDVQPGNQDPRQNLSFVVRAKNTVDVQELIKRLSEKAAVAYTNP